MTPENMPGSYARFPRPSGHNPPPPKIPESDRIMGFTVSPLWAAAIVHGGKRVENRNYKPPTELAGRRVFIHAGRGPVDDATWELLAETERRLERAGLPVPQLRGRAFDESAIVATAVISAVEDNLRATTGSSDPWRLDQFRYGWRLSAVQVIEPIPTRGWQGWWQWSKAEIAEALERRRAADFEQAALRG